MKNLKSNKAITLIALIITIIVLLILAAVTINMVLGENGLFNKAKTSVAKYENAQEKENTTLVEFEKELDKHMGSISLVYDGATTETIPYLPNSSCNFVTGTSLATGLVMKDENNNEWVWIEVPKSVTVSATTEDTIYDALVNYVQGTTNITDAATIIPRNSNYVDTWKNEDESITLSEVISETKYNTNKSKMLSSIQSNGGFWVGRYEVGIANGLYRTEPTDASKPNTAISNYTAVIQQNVKPYNNITCVEAEQLSEGLKPNGSNTTSLMYGIQWDLVLRYLYEKRNINGLTLADITSNSYAWGNFYDSTIYIGRGQYDELDISTYTLKNNWQNIIAGNKTVKYYILLTTGASDDACRMNIYDIAGNGLEWTIERANQNQNSPLILRGGRFDFDYDGYGMLATATADSHTTTKTNASNRRICFSTSTLLDVFQSVRDEE